MIRRATEDGCPGHTCTALCTARYCACPPCYCPKRPLREALLAAELEECELALAARRRVIARRVKRVPLTLFDPQPQEATTHARPD